MARATSTRKSPQGARPDEPAPDTADGAGNPSELEPRVGIAVAPLRQRRYQPQPARFVVGAAYDAERARGEPGDLIVLAVDPDELADVLARVRGAVGELVAVGEPG